MKNSECPETIWLMPEKGNPENIVWDAVPPENGVAYIRADLAENARSKPCRFTKSCLDNFDGRCILGECYEPVGEEGFYGDDI